MSSPKTQQGPPRQPTEAIPQGNSPTLLTHSGGCQSIGKAFKKLNPNNLVIGRHFVVDQFISLKECPYLLWLFGDLAQFQRGQDWSSSQNNRGCLIVECTEPQECDHHPPQVTYVKQRLQLSLLPAPGKEPGRACLLHMITSETVSWETWHDNIDLTTQGLGPFGSSHVPLMGGSE